MFFIVVENDYVRNDCIEIYKYGIIEYWYDKNFFWGNVEVMGLN